ncbi:protein spindle-F isoform X1 [Nasonia vitripennis]|uniref:UBZ1-type domain-containing protein n=1 Tax=Nasonia vitripennis TaxID=7425 RepID=A0A7M7H7H7_NASVI|nr:protein spindle-F isoform X1 [Nasonia vitripennis]XP_008210208.1 protein spindle-F isoform X1 [Nasonia vitripennis]XP_016843960.1 protein spindle-F isoform X1 [Nasonia vitripennis]XP_032457870.1 protein spindle-F isoform X1 [Nasonia vitripennis]
MGSEDTTASEYALQVAFQTMKERCQLLQARLVIVEEENISLRLKYENNQSVDPVKINGINENSIILRHQEHIEELKKEKSQLEHHIFMVASENQKLWNRLTQLTRTNKSLGNQLTKISDTLKQHPKTEIPAALTYSFKEIPGFKTKKNGKFILPDGDEGLYNLTILPNNDLHNINIQFFLDKEHSSEEVSLRLINSIMVEKSELELQYAEMTELQTNTEMNLKNIGFAYPEDISADSLEQLKYHDTKLAQIKKALLSQQIKLKLIVDNLKKTKKNETCNNCKNSIAKVMRQTGTQFDSNSSLRDNNATQTSLSSPSTLPNKKIQTTEDNNICPLCGVVYSMSVSFDLFHEHVVNHFTKDVSDDFGIVE